jgi:HK97 gp10 family phage protein
MTVKWHGDELLKQIREGTPEGLFAGGQMLVDAAASRAPKASGDLAKSGYVANEKKSTYKHDKKHNKEATPPKGGAVAGFAVFYAKFIELGTKNHPAKPFIRPAFDELKDQIGSEITITIGKRFK